MKVQKDNLQTINSRISAKKYTILPSKPNYVLYPKQLNEKDKPFLRNTKTINLWLLY